MTTADLQAVVDKFVSDITSAAADDHEAAVLLLKAKTMVDRAWNETNQAAAEAGAQLVIEKRAVESGISVSDARDAAALALKKHPSQVTALEVVNLPLLTNVETDLEDQPSPTPVTTDPAPKP